MSTDRRSPPLASGSPRVDSRVTRLDRVVAELRTLAGGASGASARDGHLAEAVRAWEREAVETRRRSALQRR